MFCNSPISHKKINFFRLNPFSSLSLRIRGELTEYFKIIRWILPEKKMGVTDEAKNMSKNCFNYLLRLANYIYFFIYWRWDGLLEKSTSYKQFRCALYFTTTAWRWPPTTDNGALHKSEASALINGCIWAVTQKSSSSYGRTLSRNHAFFERMFNNLFK